MIITNKILLDKKRKNKQW